MHTLQHWFQTAAGADLAEQETRLLTRRLAGLYAQRVLQIGAYGAGRCPAVFGGARQWVLDNGLSESMDLRADAHVLPLASGSVDVVVLVHQLEFTPRPHQVMREAARVLAPEGHMLVLGFNPISLWGLRRVLSARSASAPWRGRYLTGQRVIDWLLLLGLRPRPIERFAILPPPLRQSLRQQRNSPIAYSRALSPGLSWLGGVNLVMGQKRMPGRHSPPSVASETLTRLPRGFAQAGAGARHSRQKETV